MNARNRFCQRAAWPALLLIATSLLYAQGVCAKGVHATDAAAKQAAAHTVHVNANDHTLLRTRSAIGRIAVGDPKIADVALLNSAELLVTGKAPGTTSLLIWSRSAARRSSGQPTTYTVKVGIAGAENATGGLNVQSGTAITGQTSTLGNHAAAVSLAGKGATDLSHVNLGAQVMTNIKIVDVQRKTIHQFGLNILKQAVAGHSFYGTIAPPGATSGVALQRSGSTLMATIASASGYTALQNAFNIIIGNENDGGILGIINVLQQNGLARVLAEPTLTAMSGQTASFLAGGEIPIPVAQSSGGGTGGSAAISIQYKEFGIKLTLTPTVLSNNEIALKVAPEVSDLDFSNAVSLSGTLIPALTVRRTDTMVKLGDGQTFVISGLVSNTLSNNVNKVPWLGDIPIIGAFFRTTTYQRQRRELIMVVTPHIVKPFAAGAKLPPLPGQATDNYHPSFAQTMFFNSTPGSQLDNSSGTGYSH